MAIDKFTFISPGIFVSEVDESQNPVAPEVMGPVIIGRTSKGPGMRPVKVRSYSEFVSMFGAPHPGGAAGGDVWRSGVHTGPTYAPYAAKAWLNAGTAPATIVRLLGEDHTNANSTYKAGWTTAKDPDGAFVENGGAYGLWVLNSSSNEASASNPGNGASPWEEGNNNHERGIDGAGNFCHETGTLAAIFYIESGAQMVLSGNLRTGSTTASPTAAAGTLIKSTDSNNEFHLQLYKAGVLLQDLGKVNFTSNDERYIRNVVNTTPSLVNTDITDTSNLASNENEYWLGETFERSVAENTDSNVNQWGFIAPLMSGTTVGWHDRKSTWTNAQTNWFFSQDHGAPASYNAPDSCTKLFKFHALDYGAWANSNLKISIEDLRYGTTVTSPWGSFTVAVYRASTYDSMASSEALEKFTQCSLNPQSPNYVARKIGNKNLTWSDSNKMHTENGEYANMSKYIRIEMNPIVSDMGINKSSLPFGFGGPIRPKGFSFTALSASSGTFGAVATTPGPDQGGYSGSSRFTVKYPAGTNHASYLSSDAANLSPSYVSGGQDMPLDGLQVYLNRFGLALNKAFGFGLSASLNTGGPGTPSFSGSWVWPAVGLRSSSNDAGDGLGKNAFFGVQATKASTSNQFDHGYGDYLWGLPYDSSIAGRFDSISGAPANAEYSWVFSLDQISSSAGEYYHQSGSRKNTSPTSLTGENNSYKAVIDEGIRQFWAPMYGGTDGLNIKEAEPFRNTLMSDASNVNSYSFNSIQRAIYTVEDTEAVECNIMTVPGITKTALTDQLMDVCQTRADAIAIIDIENVFTADTEGKSSYANRLGSVSSAVTGMQTRDINNSYACTYYPWVQIRDKSSDRLVYVPPSVIALGTFASSEAKSELWFAPAGFNRGGLSAKHGAAGGMPVIGVTERLTSKKRDDLYENNINPIAKFPAEGIVVFGQKTLQQVSSALDRINVRRLMIHVKKEVSRFAASILFDQNVEVTWNRFTGQVDPFLADIKTRFGLTDFKVVLDETTTTPDLIDRNILYAKVYLKPARAIEYIAVDFIITRTGASFAD